MAVPSLLTSVMPRRDRSTCSHWKPALVTMGPAFADTNEGKIGSFNGNIRDGLWVELDFW